MGEGNEKFRGRALTAAVPHPAALLLPALSRIRRASGWIFLLGMNAACGLDFGVGDRVFECPPEVTNCVSCNADGSCRELQLTDPALPDPTGGRGPGLPALPAPSPDASVPPEQPPPIPIAPTPPSGSPDAGPTSPPDAGPPDPPPSTVCAEYSSRTSDSLCLDGDEQCFSLGSVLSPALVAWLDPTTLPQDGSRYWCDRSGQRHHALLQPDAGGVVIEPDGRAVSAALARSLLLDGAWLSSSGGTQPVLVAGNFAVVLAAAALPETGQPFELFESGEQSRINLTLQPGTGRAEGKITSLETALVTAPVVTQSSVYDGAFHLYSLYRRSEVRVLDDVLQLRLNGVLEFRGSSIAIPRALDLSSARPPRVGARSTAAGTSTTGRGRIAAAILFRGAVPEDELARLENFLCQALAVCGAPTPVTPPTITPVPLPPAALAPAGAASAR
ncbi:MAG: hypothetical protein RL033_239 [Pseudomonadota bacterium]